MNNALAYVRQPEARSSYLPLGANKGAIVVLKSGRVAHHEALRITAALWTHG